MGKMKELYTRYLEEHDNNDHLDDEYHYEKWLEKYFFNFENLSSLCGFFERRKNLLTMRLNVEPIIPLGFALFRIFLF